MPGTPYPQQNRILDALPPAERERLFPHLKRVAMPLGKVLYESGDTLRNIYFPTDSIVSLLYVLCSRLPLPTDCSAELGPGAATRGHSRPIGCKHLPPVESIGPPCEKLAKRSLGDGQPVRSIPAVSPLCCRVNF